MPVTVSFIAQVEDATGFVEAGDAPHGNYYSVSSTELATPFVDRPSGSPVGQKFPFVFPPTNVSPKNPDTTFNWAGATPIGGSDYYYYKNKMPYVQEWELSLQRQLGTATVSANYVGTVGRQLLTFVESNPGDQALCLQLSDPANVAPGTTTCGPFGEDTIYTTANGKDRERNQGPTFGINFNSNPYMKTAASSSFSIRCR